MTRLVGLPPAPPPGIGPVALAGFRTWTRLRWAACA